MGNLLLCWDELALDVQFPAAEGARASLLLHLQQDPRFSNSKLPIRGRGRATAGYPFPASVLYPDTSEMPQQQQSSSGVLRY